MRVFPCLFDGQVVSWKRVISLLINHSDVNLNIVCVYAPTQPAQGNCFLRSLHRLFFTRASLIVCGDFKFKKFCHQNHWNSIEHNNVNLTHLNWGGLHLSKSGTALLADTFCKYID